MILQALGIIIGVPALMGLANRVLEEVIIPLQPVVKLRKQRAAEAARGVPEEERAMFQRVMVDIRLTPEEYDRLEKAGAWSVFAQAAKRAPWTDRIEAQS